MFKGNIGALDRKNWGKSAIVDCLRVISGNLTGRTEENTKMLSEWLMFWSRFERGTSAIQIGSVAAGGNLLARSFLLELHCKTETFVKF